MRQVRKTSKKQCGQFVYAARDSIEQGTVELWDQAGRKTKWTGYAKLLPRTQGKRLRDFCVVTSNSGGVMCFTPAMALDTDTGYRARLFQEVCLYLLASDPELAECPKLEALLHVRHVLDDPHHIFELGDVLPRVIKHTWGSSEKIIMLGARGVRLQQQIANLLYVEANTVWVIPHASVANPAETALDRKQDVGTEP
ncbi:hypothetical protein DVH05_005282 [Phytophthora capsici]|nr:hypothetical protein DVH05_005282 [Phytophthora capsici]